MVPAVRHSELLIDAGKVGRRDGGLCGEAIQILFAEAVATSEPVVRDGACPALGPQPFRAHSCQLGNLRDGQERELHWVGLHTAVLG
jgi:hypothetical protein